MTSMPHVSSQGVRIHYEVEGVGAPLVLIPGLAGSTKAWRETGYVKELSGDYRLILEDVRGHGDSDKPHDTQAYTEDLMTGDIVAVLDDLGVDKANYWGVSMGGRIGYWLSKYHPSRFGSYILGAHSPYYPQSEAEKQGRASTLAMLHRGAEEGPEAVVSLMEKTQGPAASAEEKARRARFLDNDYKALYALYQNMFALPAVGDLLPHITVPCLLYAGERDPSYEGVREAVKHIPFASFVSLPGLGHVESFQHGDLVLPHVKRFLTRVTRK